MSGIKTVEGTIKLHAVKSSGPNKIKIRETSCYCENCYGNGTNLCDGWIEVDVTRRNKNKGKLNDL